MNEPLLSMKNISKKFITILALNNVNFNLFEGEIHALVGENGAGKSTLMRILSGSYSNQTYEGDIEMRGIKKNFLTTDDSERAGIEMIYQEISLHLDLTVAENIFLGRLPKKKIGSIDWKKTYQEAKKALNLVGLNVNTHMLVRGLNTSQKQLICIAKALFRNPKILVLDEPTSALTEREAENLMKIILNLKKQGISCVYISHKLDEVFTIADRVTVLRDGSVISTYLNSEIVPDKIIENMVGREITQMYPKVQVPIGDEILRIKEFTVAVNSSNRKNIIENISFSVCSGEILGIGGLVGSGRSELVNAIFGSIPRKIGKVFYKGKEIKIKSPIDAINHHISLVTEDRQANGFVGSMSIRENTTLASLKRIFGKLFLKKNYEIEIVENITKQLSIKAPSIETNVLHLSGGNQQKVVLSKWLLKDVKVLILDEPTRGIDIGAKVEIYNIMTQLVSKGVAIIMISSELPELFAMCDRFIILCKGSISGEFSREEITEEKMMKAATGLSN